MNWNRALGAGMLASLFSLGIAGAGTPVAQVPIELATASLKVAFGFNVACALTNENPFPVTVGSVKVLDAAGNIRASVSTLVIAPEQTRQVFTTGQNDRYHCHASGIEPAVLSDGYCSLLRVVRNLRMILDVQSGGNTIGEAEAVIAPAPPDTDHDGIPDCDDICEGTITFAFTGEAQTFAVPDCASSLTVDLFGAQGGANWVNNVNFGGRAQATIEVTPGETLYVYVGEQPDTGTAGGWNGGGAGDGAGKGGGGASDLRRGGTALTDRIVVAAGAGGAGYWSNLHVVGGVGGGLEGADGYRDPSFADNPGGRGAAQTAGGADGTCSSLYVPALAGGFGQGGSPFGSSCGCEGYGGGSGWYGGAGSGNCRGGGGGSSYVIPEATDVVHTAGARAGDGEVTLSW